MVQTIGRNTNVNDTATISAAISLNATTATTVIAANSMRTALIISNPSSKQIWLKPQAASIDDDKEGIVLFARSVYEIPTDNVYTGEYSAIADSGTPDIYVVEY